MQLITDKNQRESGLCGGFI